MVLRGKSSINLRPKSQMNQKELILMGTLGNGVRSVSTGRGIAPTLLPNTNPEKEGVRIVNKRNQMMSPLQPKICHLQQQLLKLT